MIWPFSKRAPVATASDAARTLARVKPQEQRKRVLRNMQELRCQMGMPPAKVTL